MRLWDLNTSGRSGNTWMRRSDSALFHFHNQLTLITYIETQLTQGIFWTLMYCRPDAQMSPKFGRYVIIKKTLEYFLKKLPVEVLSKESGCIGSEGLNAFKVRRDIWSLGCESPQGLCHPTRFKKPFSQSTFTAHTRYCSFINVAFLANSSGVLQAVCSLFQFLIYLSWIYGLGN